jgi:hypothetical protein
MDQGLGRILEANQDLEEAYAGRNQAPVGQAIRLP